MNTTDNHILVGKEDKLKIWSELKSDEDFNEEKMSKLTNKVKELIKNYLQLDNVNFLFGTGSSIYLRAASIQNIPLEIGCSISCSVIFVNSKSYNSKIQIVMRCKVLQKWHRTQLTRQNVCKPFIQWA